MKASARYALLAVLAILLSLVLSIVGLTLGWVWRDDHTYEAMNTLLLIARLANVMMVLVVLLVMFGVLAHKRETK